eukprot:gene21577-28575_t
MQVHAALTQARVGGVGGESDCGYCGMEGCSEGFSGGGGGAMDSPDSGACQLGFGPWFGNLVAARLSSTVTSFGPDRFGHPYMSIGHGSVGLVW